MRPKQANQEAPATDWSGSLSEAVETIAADSGLAVMQTSGKSPGRLTRRVDSYWLVQARCQTGDRLLCVTYIVTNRVYDTAAGKNYAADRDRLKRWLKEIKKCYLFRVI